MKYIKVFENHSQYQEAESNLILPNVSYCVQENEVHYNPLPQPFFCKLTLNDNSVVEIEGSGELTNAMTVDYKTTCVSAEIGELCTSIGVRGFAGFYALTSATIGDSVTSIGEYAFTHCSANNFVSIEIPSSVTTISASAFEECYNLTNVTIHAVNPPTLSDYVFYDTSVNNIYVPAASVDTYKAASGWSSYASRIQAIP